MMSFRIGGARRSQHTEVCGRRTSLRRVVLALPSLLLLLVHVYRRVSDQYAFSAGVGGWWGALVYVRY